MSKPNTINDYIESFPEDIKLLLQEIRAMIHKLVPEATEKISYGIPTIYFKENLVHFAAYEKHIGFYPSPSGITAFKEELSKYKNGKGSVQFPLNEPIPFKLIENIVKFRLAEVSEKYKNK